MVKEAACRREAPEGDGVYLSLNPMGGDCYLFFVSVGGRWGYVVEHAKS